MKMKYITLSLCVFVILAGAQCEKPVEQADIITSTESSTDGATTEMETDVVMDDKEIAQIGEEPILAEILEGFQNEDYVVTMTAEGPSSGDFGSLTVEFDAPSTSRTVIDAPGGKVESIVTPQKSYSNLGGQWIIGQGANVEQMKGVNYTKEDVAKMTGTPGIKYVGKKACDAGLCHVYRGDAEGDTFILYIDTAKKRPVKITTEQTTGDKTIINYEYTPVTITIPDVSEAIRIPTSPSADGAVDPKQLEDLMKQFENL